MGYTIDAIIDFPFLHACPQGGQRSGSANTRWWQELVLETVILVIIFNFDTYSSILCDSCEYC